MSRGGRFLEKRCPFIYVVTWGLGSTSSALLSQEWQYWFTVVIRWGALRDTFPVECAFRIGPHGLRRTGVDCSPFWAENCGKACVCSVTDYKESRRGTHVTHAGYSDRQTIGRSDVVVHV